MNFALQAFLNPSEALALLRSLWLRERDPVLEGLRWRLHQRLLLVSAGLSAGFFLYHLSHGRVDEVGLGVLACLAALAWIRRHPAHNRLVARLNLAVFLLLALNAAFLIPNRPVLWAVLSMMVMTIFGTLLDGVVSGAVAALLTVATGALCLAGGQTQDMPLVVAFSMVSAVIFFTLCLAHTWFYDRLVERLRVSGRGVAEANAAAEALTLTLSRDVADANRRLRRALEDGLKDLSAAGEMKQILAAARGRLPADLPRAAMEPDQLFEGLRHRAHRFYLGAAAAASLAATLAILALHMDLWQLSLGVALVIAGLLWAGPEQDSNWRWRLHGFLAACLAAMALDVHFSLRPPAASLVFLPLVVFYAGLLASPRLALGTALAGCGLLAWAAGMPGAGTSEATVHVVLALLSLAMAGIGWATVPMYRRLLRELAVEEERLRQGLASYRRMVSILFHDLANPLAVLQSLGSLPPALLTPEDDARAHRMLVRLEALARQALQVVDPAKAARVSAAQLGDQLYDLFRERLREKQLRLKVTDGADVELRAGGAALRDLVLGHLMSNAVKYSPKAGLIGLAARHHDGWITLSLRDQGPGFPEDVLEDIVQGLSPKVRPGTQGETGLGYGLLEAMAAASELGGHLSLSTHPDGGAVAELWMPEGDLPG